MDDLISRKSLLEKTHMADVLRAIKGITKSVEVVLADDVEVAPSAFDGMTNGDIFTTIYPDYEAEKVGLYMVLRPKRKKGIEDTHILVDLDFWNAPYKAEM